MSILNQTGDGFPQILIVLWRALKVLGPQTEEKLTALCAPPSIGDDKHVKDTLRRWKQLGLFASTDDSLLRLASPFDDLPTAEEPEHRAFRREVRRLALRSSNNTAFLEQEPGDAADFTFAAAWLLSTDVYAEHCQTLTGVQTLERSHVQSIGEHESKYAIQNDTRWNGFKNWTAFLGFGWNTSPFQLDPTEAIEDELETVLSGPEAVPIGNFRQRLSEQLPILDCGHYSQRARERAKPGWRAIGDHEVSPALTRALLRLQLSDHISLEDRADADRLKLLGPSFDTVGTATHITRKAGPA